MRQAPGRRGAVSLALALALAVAAPAGAQVDTLRVDTLQVDTLRSDSLGVDTAAVGPDSLLVGEELPDSLRVDTLPSMPGGAPAGFGSGVWVFGREDLLSTRAISLVDLLAHVPGMISLRGGDYGSPRTATAFGLGGGRIRVFWDGFEMLPLDGAVVDLARVGLAGLESVRVERGMGEVRIELESLKVTDPRPMSVVEAGTGDFDTNLFRGTFVHPRALGGNVGVALERLDTRGAAGAETGSQSGFWTRYTYRAGESFGLKAELRQGRAESAVEPFPPQVTRRDWTLRARGRLAPGVVGELFTGGSSVEGGEDDGWTPLDQSRRQHGARVSFEGGPLWGRGAFRVMEGGDQPSTALEMEGGASSELLGGVALGLSREGWEGESTSLTTLRAWSRPLLGLSVFGSWQAGTRGARIFRPREPVPQDPVDPGDGEEGEGPEEPELAPPGFRVTDRTGLRVGASGRWGPLDVSGAWLELEADSLVPLGILVDREGVAVAGGTWTGYEVTGKLDLPLGGFGLYGSLQQWDAEARYLPERIYAGGVDFHDVFLESGNLELWGSIGVQGRDPMLVPLAREGWEPPPEEPGVPVEPVPLARVPFLQSWHAFIQVRIVTVRAFIYWENFTVRRELQDFPGRRQPITRAMYGVRWTLWN